MSLYWDKKLICEVNVYADKNIGANGKDWWHVEISSYFDVKNLLCLYENDHVGDTYFIEEISSIQKYRLGYTEGCDKDFPKPTSYLLGDTKLNEDRGKIIDIIRKRLQKIGEDYNLYYKED